MTETWYKYTVESTSTEMRNIISTCVVGLVTFGQSCKNEVLYSTRGREEHVYLVVRSESACFRTFTREVPSLRTVV